MRADDVKFVGDLVYRTSGLVLNADKDYLIESRLAPLARKHGYPQLTDFVAALRNGSARGLGQAVAEALATHESSFFRDIKPFDVFSRELFPEMVDKRGRNQPIRIWSAASSTGQEAYSLAMSVNELLPRFPDLKVEIVGTDLSAMVVERARKGEYSLFEVQRGLSIQRLVKNFEQRDGRWVAKSHLVNMVKFATNNLLERSNLGKFDVVFLRNVLIYFDQETKRKVIDNVVSAMNPSSYLVLGGTETIIGLSERVRPHETHRMVYRLAPL